LPGQQGGEGVEFVHFLPGQQGGEGVEFVHFLPGPQVGEGVEFLHFLPGHQGERASRARPENLRKNVETRGAVPPWREATLHSNWDTAKLRIWSGQMKGV
jgi:hypothetical protein